MIPLLIDGQAPPMLPAYPLPGQNREGRCLYIIQRDLHFRTRFGLVRVPAGYITDFASIPRIVAWDIKPLDSHAWAAVLHDWMYAVGEPGRKDTADTMFRDQMERDGVWAVRREVMYQAVRLGGKGGYAKAGNWWATENFADPETGRRIAPRFDREQAFAGQPFGLT